MALTAAMPVIAAFWRIPPVHPNTGLRTLSLVAVPWLLQRMPSVEPKEGAPNVA